MIKKETYKITGVSCNHSAAAVKNAVRSLSGVKHVDISLEKMQADVEYDDTLVSLESIKTAIDDQGYDVV